MSRIDTLKDMIDNLKAALETSQERIEQQDDYISELEERQSDALAKLQEINNLVDKACENLED